jgi:hypothetical protein
MAQPTANTNRTANMNKAHGKIQTHGILQRDTRQNNNTRHSAIKTHGKQTPTANWRLGPTCAANLTVRPNGQHFAVSLTVTHGKMFNF